MDRKFVEKTIAEHNALIDNFISEVLPERLEDLGFEVRDGRIPFIAYFAATDIIKEQGFRARACAVQEILRHEGYDVKRDALSDKLVWYGGVIDECGRSV